jgi:hypothetical protein
MSDVQRYTPETGSGSGGDCWTEMVKDKNGDWVTIEEYTAAEHRAGEMEARYDRLTGDYAKKCEQLAEAERWIERSPHIGNCPAAWVSRNHAGRRIDCTCGKWDFQKPIDYRTEGDKP